MLKKFTAVAIAMVVTVTGWAYSPDPVGILLTVGRWIVQNSTNVYYVRVEATAKTESSARDVAFKTAVEDAVGSLILSNREVKNDHLVNEEIINYSSGYVDNYKLISSTQNGNSHTVVMDVWVSNSKIARRLEYYGVAAGGSIDGSAIEQEYKRQQVQQATHKNSIEDALKVSQAVLRDYPRMAYDLRIDKTWIEGDNLRIQLDIGFSSQYIDSLDEVLQKTRQVTYARKQHPGVRIKHGFFSWTNGAWMPGTGQFDLWRSTFKQPVLVKMNFYDEVERRVFYACWRPTTLENGLYGYEIDNNPVNRGFTFYNEWSWIIYGGSRVKETFTVANKRGNSTDHFIKWVSQFRRVEAQVIAGNKCSD